MIFYNQFLDKHIMCIHIPRTAGRAITKMMLNNDWEPLDYTHTHKYFYGREYLHLDYKRALIYYGDQYSPQFFNNSFAVIRHPVDRFMSASSYIVEYFQDEKININDLYSSYESFCYYMEDNLYTLNVGNWDSQMLIKGLKNFVNNWFEHQNKFISPSTKLWKYEDGLGLNFTNWLNKTYDLNLLNSPDDYRKAFMVEAYDKKDKLKNNSKLTEYILQYYKEDMELWKSL